MTQHPLGTACLAGALLTSLAPAALAANSDASAPKATQDAGYALVQLAGEPLSTYERTKPPKGKKVDFASNTARAYRAQLSNLRNTYKAWLKANVPQANVSAEFDISLNAVAVKLNGASLAQVSATPLVRRAELQGLYRPTQALQDPDLPLIDAAQAWARHGGTAADAGKGVKVAIVDTGIDVTHPCFSDTGYAKQTQLGDKRFTNNKVIVAKVFNNKLPSNGFSAAAIQDHGSHVAGTVACKAGTPASVSGVTIPFGISGVAPAALLGNYNVFPGDVENARSEDILNALEAAYADGFDVANMSLGGNAHGVQDLLTIAVDNLDRANMVVAVSAGNEGGTASDPFTVGSPGSAARALTAGASTVPHFIAAPLRVGSVTYGAASGDFAIVKADTSAPLAAVTSTDPKAQLGLGQACTALPAGSLAGKVALIVRGGCTFSTKVRNAQTAGAAVVLVTNNVAGDPVAMASDGTPDQPTVPAYMVSIPTATVIKPLAGSTATIGVTLAYLQTDSADIMAGFSSAGPTDVDWRVKPDVVAPGVNVLSSVPASFCAAPPCFAFLSGTSMAAPHLAGSAAVVRQQHPDWSSADVRSAVVNTADRGVLRDAREAKPIDDVNVVGTGRENLLSAVNASVSLEPVSLSFGGTPSGSGQTKTLSLTLTNTSTLQRAYTLEVIDAKNPGVTFSVATPTTASLAPGASATVAVSVAVAKGAPAGNGSAVLKISSGDVVAHAALYTLVK